MTPFSEWLPDQSALMASSSTVAQNVIADVRGYKPFNNLTAFSGAADNYIRGMATAKTSIGTVQAFAGDGAKLYKQNATTRDLDNVSKSGNYSLVSDEKWQFVQFGNDLIAAGSLNHPLQKYEVGASSNFSDISGAPAAKFCAVVRDFVVTANVAYGANDFPYRVRWSQLGNGTDFTIGTGQSDIQDIPDDGHITGIVGGEYGVVFLERAIARMTYVGSPLIFTFEKVENRGCNYAGSIASLGPSQIFYLAEDGFFFFNGSQSMPIGAGKVDEFFAKDLGPNFTSRITCSIDPLNQLVMWSYPSIESTGEPDSIIIYNYAVKKWSLARIDHESIGVSLTLGTSLENLANISSTLEGLTTSLDSPAYRGGSFQLSASKDKKLCNFSGTPLDATLETAEFEPVKNGFSLVRSVSPYVTTRGADTALTVRGSVGTRSRQVAAPTFTPAVELDANNLCNVRSNGRYHRVRVNIAGNWDSALGVSTDIVKSSQR